MATEAAPTARLAGITLFAALLVVVTWLLMLIWLVLHTDATEVIWARWLTVLASLEAVAFAAAGAMFGTAVQRQRVSEAQGRASKAEGEAKANAKDAANGRSLAAAVKISGQGLSRVADGAVGRGDTQQRSASDDLAELARRLFPD